MKKIILSGAALLAIAAGAVFNVNLNSQSNNLSAMTLANVEALAQGEGVNVETCYSTYRITLKNPNKPEPIWAITACSNCSQVSCYEYKDSSTCTKNSGFIWV
ncbi:hypothetical protein AGMMS50239_24790 [Bacteroidia bacterium]|nr:hypothetical protein AGMMS50239_24790 [Bacteroidia bacterium]